MKITPAVFEAYLKCPTKCWLRSIGEPATGNTYSEWVKAQNDSYRATARARLLAESPNDEVALSPDLENLKAAKWRWAASAAVQAHMDSCDLESELHAVERVTRMTNCCWPSMPSRSQNPRGAKSASAKSYMATITRR